MPWQPESLTLDTRPPAVWSEACSDFSMTRDKASFSLTNRKQQNYEPYLLLGKDSELATCHNR